MSTPAKMDPALNPHRVTLTCYDLEALVGNDHAPGNPEETDKLSIALSALSQAGRELCVMAYLPKEGEIDADDIQFILWRLGERLKGIAEILARSTPTTEGSVES